MSDSPSRRNFMKMLGLTAGAALTGTSALAAFVDKTEILRLTPEQQEFMLKYGQWMDEFTEVIRLQKTEPDNLDNHRRMIALTERSDAMQPALSEHLKDETFSLIYKASIERMTKEI